MDSGLAREYRRLLLQLAADRPAGDLFFAGAALGSGGLRSQRAVLYRHVSDRIEIAFAVEGEARVITPAAVFHLTADKLLAIEPGVWHGQLPAVASGRHRVLWLHLSQTTVELSDSVYAYPAAGGFLHQHFLLPGQTNVESIGKAIISELVERPWGYQHAIAGLLRYLAHVLVRRLLHAQVAEPLTQESPIVAGDRRIWDAIEAALRFCDAHFREDITRSDIGRAVGYSPRNLSRLMSTYLGRSLSDHIRDLRMLDARRLLEKSSLSVREIALAVGYSDTSHFTRAFTRATGLSPRAYRHRLGTL
jgi:AraC-like DNA-binding protein